MAYEFRLPDIGEGLHEAEILNWLVHEGDVIEADQPIVELQTDKAAVEIASPVGGKVVQLGAKAGETLKVGGLLVAVDTGEASTELSTAEKVESPSSDESVHKVLAAPAVRKFARDQGVDLLKVARKDSGGRITRADVERFIAKQTAQKGVDSHPIEPYGTDRLGMEKSSPRQQQFEDGITEKRVPIRGLRKRIYENMTRTIRMVPQVTGMDDLNATRLVELREQLLPYAKAQAVKLTYLPFIIKAVTHILKMFPVFNATVDDENMEIVYRKQIHIGFATAIPEGLIVPVIKNADEKSLFTIARELDDLSHRARERKLTYEEVTGSTFTISSTGANGGWFATPMIYHPEVAILGAHAIVKKPVVVDDDRIVSQQRMGFSLTFDHRVIDGEPAGAFMFKFKEIIEHPELLLAL